MFIPSSYLIYIRLHIILSNNEFMYNYNNNIFLTKGYDFSCIEANQHISEIIKTLSKVERNVSSQDIIVLNQRISLIKNQWSQLHIMVYHYISYSIIVISLYLIYMYWNVIISDILVLILSLYLIYSFWNVIIFHILVL